MTLYLLRPRTANNLNQKIHGESFIRIFVGPLGHFWLTREDELEDLVLWDADIKFPRRYSGDARLIAEGLASLQRWGEMLDVIQKSGAALRHILRPDAYGLTMLSPNAAEAQSVARAMLAQRKAQLTMNKIRLRRTL